MRLPIDTSRLQFLVVAAAELTQDDLEVIKTSVQPDWIETIWTGDTVTTDLAYGVVDPRIRYG